MKESGAQSIEWAYFADTGEKVAAVALNLAGLPEFHRLRVRVWRAAEDAGRRDPGDGRLLCGNCHKPVYVTGWRDQSHRWFRHYSSDGHAPGSVEVGEVPRVDRGLAHLDPEAAERAAPALCGWTAGDATRDPADVRAAMYAGRQESERHIRLKLALAECVALDRRNSGVRVDQYRQPRLLDQRGRFPDVAFMRDGTEWALEIQASALLGKDAAARDRFYELERVRLLWIFPADEPRQSTREDERAKNRGCLFLFNEAAARQSRMQNELVLQLIGSSLGGEPFTRYVTLEDLSVDTSTLRPYFDSGAPQRRMHSLKQGRRILRGLRAPTGEGFAFPAGPGRAAQIAHWVFDTEPGLRHILAAALLTYRPLGTDARGFPVDGQGRRRAALREKWDALRDVAYVRDADELLAREFPELVDLLLPGWCADEDVFGEPSSGRRLEE